MRVTIIQLNSSGDKSDNFNMVQKLVRAAAKSESPDIVVLPEMALFASAVADKVQASADEIRDDNPTIKAFSALAKELAIFIHIGSLIELYEGSYYNSAVAFDRAGNIIARYRKMHLFDIVLPDGTPVLESSIVCPGKAIVQYEADSLRIGCSICYDLRFSELYRELRKRGANTIIVPAAFAQQTGIDHWEVLLRARAIETQCYVIAPAQVGALDNGKISLFAHSMIIDPWGQVVAQVSNKTGWASANIDLDWVGDVRRRIPMEDHRVLD